MVNVDRSPVNGWSTRLAAGQTVNAARGFGAAGATRRGSRATGRAAPLLWRVGAWTRLAATRGSVSGACGRVGKTAASCRHSPGAWRRVRPSLRAWERVRVRGTLLSVRAGAWRNFRARGGAWRVDSTRLLPPGRVGRGDLTRRTSGGA